MDVWKLLLDIVLLLTASLVLGGIFSRFGQSPLVGYLLAGMFLGGPGSIRLLRLESDVEAIAELGVSLLLFSLGLEFSWQRLRSLGAKSLFSGILQVLVTFAIGTAGSALLLPSFKEAIVIGAMVSLSSTVCVVRVLMEHAEIDSAHGRNALAILLVQDIAVVPLALAITILGGQGSALDVAYQTGKAILLAGGLILGLFLLLNKVAVWALGTLTLERNRELTVLLAVSTGLGAAWAAHTAGLSPALGAFTAGLFLAGSPFAVQIRADISSLRIVLLTLFFGAAGMVADPLWMFQHAGAVLIVTAGILVGKALLIWLIFRLLGQSDASGIATGLCLAQVGEFAFVLGTIGKNAGLLSEETHMMMVSTTILSLFFTPFLVPRATRVGALVQAVFHRQRAPTAFHPSRREPFTPQVAIIGFGPAGQQVGHAIREHGLTGIVLDLNPKAKQLAEELGLVGQIGDATQSDVLEHARLAEAKIIFITIPSRTAALSVLEQARRLFPHAHVVVRSRYSIHRPDFEAAGAHAVVEDEIEAGSTLAHYLDGQLANVTRPEKE